MFRDLLRKDEGREWFEGLRELTRLKAGVVRDIDWLPWN